MLLHHKSKLNRLVCYSGLHPHKQGHVFAAEQIVMAHICATTLCCIWFAAGHIVMLFLFPSLSLPAPLSPCSMKPMCWVILCPSQPLPSWLWCSVHQDRGAGNPGLAASLSLCASIWGLYCRVPTLKYAETGKQPVQSCLLLHIESHCTPRLPVQAPLSLHLSQQMALWHSLCYIFLSICYQKISS